MFQSDNVDTNGLSINLKYSSNIYLIQEGDFLNINIKSPDGSSLIFFNNNSSNNLNSNEASLYQSSYIVNQEGNVILPTLGEFLAKGKTTLELKNEISKKLQKYYKIADVSVKMMSFKVTFIGEVNRPSTFFIYNMNTTFFEGLSKVGGITEYTNTHKLTIVRKLKNSEAKAYKVDINGIDFMESEFYYLKPGDIIYLEPVRYKTFTKNTSVVSFAISISTFLFTLFALNRN